MKNFTNRNRILSFMPAFPSAGALLLTALEFIYRQIDSAVVAIMAFVLVHGRWASIIYPLPLNPDEAQAAANALRIKAYGFNWNVLDGSTSGPLNSLALCWPYLFGWDVTLSTTRLTACVLIMFICAFAYLSVKAVSGRVIAALLVLPLVIFYSITTNDDFLHYHSELLPVALLVVGHYIATRISVNHNRRHEGETVKFALLGLALGMVPFAKLQAAPIGAVIGLYALFLAVADPLGARVRRSIALICGSLTPACGFLLPLLVSGHIRDFWRSYIVYAFLYIKEPLAISNIQGMIADDLLLKSVSYFMFTLAAAALLHSLFVVKEEDSVKRKAIRRDVTYGIALVIAAFWAIAKPGNDYGHYLTFYFPFVAILCAYFIRGFADRRKDIALFASYYAVLALVFVGVFTAGLAIVAFWVIAKPGSDYPHYLMFYPPCVVILCAYVIRALAEKKKDVILFAAYYAAFALVFVGIFVAGIVGPVTKNQAWILDNGLRPLVHPSFETRSPHILSWLPISSTHLLVWGWMPQWYVWSDLTPASREANTYSELSESALQGYFRSRFMSDITAAPPDVIMDAVAGKSFFFKDPSHAGPSVFPEFAAYLSNGYTQLAPWEPEADCPKLYVKNAYKALLDRRLISPASVTTSANLQGGDSPYNGAKLFDNSVTEDTCVDYWLLPDGKTGSVDVKFAKVEPVSNMAVLNTGNSHYLDRASNEIEIKLLKSGAVVGDKKITMKPHPYWTAVELDGPIEADELEIDILSFYGRGGGLNEIKIYRP